MKGTKKDVKVEPIMKDITDEWKEVSQRNVKEVRDLTEYEANGTVYKVDGFSTLQNYIKLYKPQKCGIFFVKFLKFIRCMVLYSY